MLEHMPFRFNQKKTTQAVALLLGLSENRSSKYMRLLKLLYIADRESLQETGRPITGDRFFAMEQGPVLSELLDLIKGNSLGHAEWSQFIARQGYHVELINDPGDDELCRYEEQKLREVWQRYKGFNEWHMVNETHKLPEWQKNDPGKSSKPIPLSDVLEALGKSEHLHHIYQDARQSREMANFFGD